MIILDRLACIRLIIFVFQYLNLIEISNRPVVKSLALVGSTVLQPSKLFMVRKCIHYSHSPFTIDCSHSPFIIHYSLFTFTIHYSLLTISHHSLKLTQRTYWHRNALLSQHLRHRRKLQGVLWKSWCKLFHFLLQHFNSLSKNTSRNRITLQHKNCSHIWKNTVRKS